MKKSQLVAVALAAAIALATAFLPGGTGGSTSSTPSTGEGPAVSRTLDAEGDGADGTSRGEGDGLDAAGPSAPDAGLAVAEDGRYTSKDEVALYLHLYGHLPSNFISKTKAREAGWVSSKGNLDEVCPGMSIGGSDYYNEGWDGEELLPEAKGRTWKECDINYHGGYRGAERLVFSNDGLIFYTADHYQTFERLY